LYDLDRINNFIRFIRSNLSNLTQNLTLQQVIDFASINYFDKSENMKNKEEIKHDHPKSKNSFNKNHIDIYSIYPSNFQNFERTVKFNKNDDKDIIIKFSNELNNPKYKIDYSKNKGISRSKSYSKSISVNNKQKEDSSKINENDYDKIVNNNDINKIKKNNKLLELIVVRDFVLI